MKNFIFDVKERSGAFDVNYHWWSGEELSEHYHSDYYEILIITDGEISTRINDEVFVCKKGDLIFLCPNTSHSITKGCKSAHCNMAVREEFFNSLIMSNDTVTNALSRGFIIFTPPVLTFNFILSLARKIDNDNITALSHSLTDCILSTLICHIMLEKTPSLSLNKIESQCKDAISKIDSGKFLSKKVNDIISAYPISQPSFIAQFKKITGKTPSKYLNEKRLQKAKKLLLTTNLSVLDISLNVGYDSLSHFIKIFKKRYNLTPLEYKLKANEKDKIFTHDT